MIFPWHIKQWQMAWARKLNNSLPHAWLMMGECDFEKNYFSETLSAAILCTELSNNASQPFCGHCHSCRLFMAKSHPDFVVIEPEQPSQVIKIDQIRNLVQQVNETSMQGGFRVVLIRSAHAMNMAAANALLKTLEEPPAKTLIILSTKHSSRLPATVRSRCQKVAFDKASHEEAMACLVFYMAVLAKETPDFKNFLTKTAHVNVENIFNTLHCENIYQLIHCLQDKIHSILKLQEAGQFISAVNAFLAEEFKPEFIELLKNEAALSLSMAEAFPLKALAFMLDGTFTTNQKISEGLYELIMGRTDPLVLAATLQEYNIATTLYLLLIWIRDLMRYKLINEDAPIINYSYRLLFQKIRVSRDDLLSFINELQFRYSKIQNSQTLNKQLVLEELLIQMSDIICI